MEDPQPEPVRTTKEEFIVWTCIARLNIHRSMGSIKMPGTKPLSSPLIHKTSKSILVVGSAHNDRNMHYSVGQSAP